MSEGKMSIIREMFTDRRFFDRYVEEGGEGIDVIIPLIHSNELFRNNLFNYYREIPIKRLLISDGGCIDDSMEVLREFPRVVLLDHKDIISQGYCIRKLVEAVETEWFVYLHSDVYLPEGWMEKMNNYRDKHEWIESKQHQTVLMDVPLPYDQVPERSFSGGQLGKTDILKKALSEVEDDYLFRTEDIIIADLVKRTRSRYGRPEDVYLHHQEMWRKSKREMPIRFVQCVVQWEREEEIHTYETMAKSLVKYMKPENDYIIQTVQNCFHGLVKHEAISMKEIEDWVEHTNPVWMAVLFPNRRDPESQILHSHEQEKLKGVQAKLLRLSEMIGEKVNNDWRMDESGRERVEQVEKWATQLMDILS